METLPFTISPDAERFLADRLAKPRDEHQCPYLALARRLRVRDRSGKTLDAFDDPHFQLGYLPRERLSGASPYLLVGHTVFLAQVADAAS